MTSESSGSDPRRYRLDFANAAYEASRVVLALPQRSLMSAAQASNVFANPSVHELIRSVTAQPMTKIFLCYDRPWWRQAGIRGRRTVSDLPLRKTYFFDPPRVEPREAALLLASYCDGPSVDHWRQFAAMSHLPSDGADFNSAKRWEQYVAPPELIEEAHRHVKALHPYNDAPAPEAGAFMDWGAGPYEGAWHSWNTGVKSWEVMPRLTQPVSNEDVYICGEACSSYQGWMEGALETAETVVRRITNVG